MYRLLPEVSQALASSAPVVALETAVLTHGLPRPANIQLVQDMENAVRQEGAIPATIGLLDGRICIGLAEEERTRLGNESGVYKVSRRDFGVVIARKASGGTTVAGTLIAAHAAGMRVFATGGIGGVHRGAPFDISTDLEELSRTPLVVVCAGAKSILDLPATLEYLETAGVPVIGYQTDEFPAFYARSSGLRLPARVESVEEAADIYRAHTGMGMTSALLVVVPPPEEVALSEEFMEAAIAQALEEAHAQKVSGQAVTPFLLERVAQITGGESLKANLGLLLNNARLAAKIAVALAGPRGRAI